MLSNAKLDSIIARADEVSAQMVENPDRETYVKLARELSDLEPIVANIRALREAQNEVADLLGMVADPETDNEVREMAELEVPDLRLKIGQLETDIQLQLLPKDIADNKNAIVEVRAGTGGDEAALFAGDLFRMYERYAALRGWKFNVMTLNEGDVGGFKEAIANISGEGVFARLKFESGVHRVQRVPETESGGRVHTSAATVAVLPEAEEVDIEVRNEDIRIDTMRASGAGGQHVNTTDSAVRITHEPSGIVVTSSEKSQHQNRANAMKELRARLYDMERQKADQERADSRKGQVGSGDRSERIRTYNFPQGRVSDHRINLTLYKLDKVLTGEAMDELLDALITDHQATLLAAVEEE